MSREALDYFSKMIERETGINYSDTNLYQLQSRLEEFCKSENLTGLEVLCQRFQTSPQIGWKQKLIDLATNNETSFFRDPVYYRAVLQFLMDEILPYKPSQLRIWSAAASTGQEAISIAITLDELSRTVSLPPWKIVATDICQKVLDRCQAGTYSDFELMRGMSPERKDRYFLSDKGVWKIRPEIQSRIEIQTNNLTMSRISGPFDLIFCRNVLIYQKVENKKRILDNLMKELSPRGALLLGVGETLFGVTDNVNSTLYSGVVLYKNEQKKAA
ncbi:MAG: protein-glutamate O-methyltransferase CheR [Bdellovibrionota bacterium]